MQDEEFIQGFIEEAKVHLETVETELVQMDTNDINEESINNMFRAVHSIKGTSSFFNFRNIVELSHSLENIFGEVRAGSLKITDGMIDIILAANDILRTMVDDVTNSDSLEISGIMSQLSEILGTDRHGESKAQSAPGNKTESLDYSSLGNSGTQKQKIISELKRGCRLYRVRKWLLGDGIDLLELIREIRSFGSVIDCHVEDCGPDNTAEAHEDDVQVEILFTTVLELDMLPPILSEQGEDIQELLAEAGAEVSTEDMEPGEASGYTEAGRSETDRMEPAGGLPLNKRQSITVEDSIRVNVTLLNSLLNMASELVLARNQLLRTTEDFRKQIPGIEPILQNVDHITTGLQEKIMQTRMQPVSIVFSKFPRIARELSKKLGKDIMLEIEGAEVELDKSIIEALYDPLTHLVRNAVDHGLETPEERIGLGKPRAGTVKLKAYHEGGYVNIDIIDDGKGINIERIRTKAMENGSVSKADISAMGDREILQLLFKPGFSTAEKITDISGRGVGMDVVKTNIEKLGGKIEIFTTLGAGTTFRLLLPLTLAIIPSLILEVTNQKFALPQVNLQEIVRIKENDALRKIEYINNAEVLRLRGRLLPIVHLADILGLQRTYIDPVTGEVKEDKRKTLFDARHSSAKEADAADGAGLCYDRRKRGLKKIVRILVIKIGARRLGLCVDKLHGSEEILVKPLPVYIQDCICYSGVTILGDGKTAMILDPSGIIEKANLHYTEEKDEKGGRQLEQELLNMYENQNILLFKCSGPETMAIDMSMVSRVEEISTGDIERIGDKEYIKFRGQSLRIIRPEDFLPITRQKSEKSKLYIIIPKLVKHPMGILIESIQDTLQSSIDIRGDDSITAKGLVGSTVINNRIVLLMNIYEVFEMADPEKYKVENNIKHTGKITVLLAEDTPFFQRLEKNYLEDAGYDVLVTSNGREALEVLQDKKVDIVLSDINMPEMNGLELVKRIRADAGLARTPVIAVTSLTGDMQKREGLEAGFDAYEYKLDRSRLLELVDRIIRERGITA
ncbi:MAG TPA: chemotaxis protein CheW [Clostridia bacterium]|nr:chemotaxis protein CheW [Clostridia bacterium]